MTERDAYRRGKGNFLGKLIARIFLFFSRSFPSYLIFPLCVPEGGALLDLFTFEMSFLTFEDKKQVIFFYTLVTVLWR
jgi:hypothetical protein